MSSTNSQSRLAQYAGRLLLLVHSSSSSHSASSAFIHTRYASQSIGIGGAPRSAMPALVQTAVTLKSSRSVYRTTTSPMWSRYRGSAKGFLTLVIFSKRIDGLCGVSGGVADVVVLYCAGIVITIALRHCPKTLLKSRLHRQQAAFRLCISHC